jgi:hypothetical protein
MYKFVVIQGRCGQPYNVSESEQHANRMEGEGFDLVQVYQTTTSSCFGSSSSLVMVFKKRG